MISSRILALGLLLGSTLLLSAQFQAGIAVRIVTPDPLLPVSGGIGPANPVREKKGELTVRALVFDQKGTRVAMVSCDYLGFPSVLGDRVRAKVAGIPKENILIGATHTHSAPDMYGFPDGKGGFSIDLKYVDRVVDQMAEAIKDAQSKLQPASIRIASGVAKGKIAFNYYAETLYDQRCHVIQALNAQGQPIATLVNYAIHPEVLGSSVGICSPDLVGPLYDRLTEKGAGVGIFLNSAQGGMVTADNRGPKGEDFRTWEECVRIGNLLADEALRLLSKAPVQSDPTLFCTARRVRFPVESKMLLEITRLSPLGFPAPEPGDFISTQMNLINLGNAQILTIPGEALPNIGFYLKRKMHGVHNLLFGLTNDAFGYMLTKVDYNSFRRYDYVTRTSLGEMTGEILIEEALKLADSAPRPEKGP
ncbi:MAG: hypothetical protein JNN07_13470 [Verrucomicrobiales bacterium]|nr:hypothetical protein [Verrucomicrobiales bacterium]